MEVALTILVTLIIIWHSIVIYDDIKTKKEKNKPIIIEPQTHVEILMKDKSIDTINIIVDTLIKDAADKYMILNVNFDREAYLNSKSIDDLSAYIFGMVKKNMTPTVKETIGLIHDISTEEKLNDFLKLRIKIYVLALAVKTNQPL